MVIVNNTLIFQHPQFQWEAITTWMEKEYECFLEVTRKLVDVVMKYQVSVQELEWLVNVKRKVVRVRI